MPDPRGANLSLIDSLRETIAAKDALIESQKAHITDLQRRLAIAERDRDARYTEAQVRAAVIQAVNERLRP